MADRYGCTMMIGGKLPIEKMDEFVGLIEDEMGSFEKPVNSPVEFYEQMIKHGYIDKILDPLEIRNDEARWGEMEDLENFCTENNLSYKKASDSYYGCSPELCVFNPEYSSKTHICLTTDQQDPFILTGFVSDFLKFIKLYNLKEDMSNHVFKTLTDADIEWIKNNIDINNKDRASLLEKYIDKHYHYFEYTPESFLIIKNDKVI